MILTQPQDKPWQDPLSTFPCLCQGSRRFMRPQEILAFLYWTQWSRETPENESLAGDRSLPDPHSYSRQYPKNSRSLTTFSYLTKTVMRRREPLLFFLTSFL